MNRKMKSAVIYGPFDLRIENLELPELDNDSIILKVHKAAICNATEYHILEGSYTKQNPWLKLPHILGHECSGEIIEIGKNVKGFNIGDRIAFGCKMGGMDGGAFAEYNRVYPGKLFSISKLAENLTYDEGALLEPLYGVLEGNWSAGVRPGDKVLILGMGPIGLLHLQVTRLSMSLCLVATDVHETRLTKAKELGADIVINVSKENIVEKVKEYCGELDIIIDTTGSTKTNIDDGIEMLKPNGKYLIYGHAMGKTAFTPMKLSTKGVQIIGFDLTAIHKMIPLANKLVSQGRVNVRTLITHHIRLDDIEKGILMCHNEPDEVLKVIVDIQQ